MRNVTLRALCAGFVSLGLLLLASPLGAQDWNEHIVGAQPAATLLYPYFEVDFDGSSTTLIAFTNAKISGARLARVTFWTDWDIPVFTFDVYLGPGDVQTINVRDIFATGVAPTTGPGADSFPGCDSDVGGSVGLSGTFLRQIFTGQSFLGKCFARPRADHGFLTGYITVDVVQRCGIPSATPAAGGYFGGADPIASNENALFGDFFLVDVGENFAQGNRAVHIVADPEFFVDGDYTFYGRLVGWDGSDARMPMARIWDVRFITGGGFDGGTDLIVWRDTKTAPSVGGIDCGVEGPGAWYPLEENHLLIYDEQSNSMSFDDTSHFEYPINKMNVTFAPFSFGWMQFDMRFPGGENSQAYIMATMNASGLYSVGQTTMPLDSAYDFGP